MKYPNTGPYQFCLKLGSSLSTFLDEDERLTYLISPKTPAVFGSDKNYYKLSAVNKLYLPWKQSRYVGGGSRFDVWHAAYQSTMYYPLNKRTKVVLTIHDLNFLHEQPDNPKNKKHLKLIQDRIERADHVVCISNFCLNDVKQHLKLSVPSSVIYNGADRADMVAVTVPPAKPFLFALGTVLPKKNFHVLPALLAGTDFDLVIAGIDQTPYKEKIIEAAKLHRVENRVRFTGPISDQEKSVYFQTCTAFLFPSIAEGFGLPVIEAMSYGKPVFLSTHTALPEVGGDVAYYFKDFSPEPMRNTLALGLAHFKKENPENKIREWAAQFSWETAAKSYLKIYRSLL